MYAYVARHHLVTVSWHAPLAPIQASIIYVNLALGELRSNTQAGPLVAYGAVLAAVHQMCAGAIWHASQRIDINLLSVESHAHRLPFMACRLAFALH